MKIMIQNPKKEEDINNKYLSRLNEIMNLIYLSDIEVTSLVGDK